MNPLAARRQSGFSTIESLISIVILAVVALGMAGMTAQASRQQKNAHNLYRATLLLNDLGERVRASQAVAIKGAFESALNFGADAQGPKQDCFTSACTVEETAAFEVAAWLVKVRTELPQGSAQINYAPAAPLAGAADSGLYTIMLVWRETGVVTGVPNTGANDPACVEVTALAANQQARCFTSRMGV
jgi:type IV pilus modification protein PilV